ncbi:rhomboid family intramembrane serine protease [Ideonella sp. DXS29W]|uniref:Rhomboid family intramembrane serine protease n=1 Tax=Ideonella lacteola TaxID=2984193 RepID=A0ABU9BRY9_9BURK
MTDHNAQPIEGATGHEPGAARGVPLVTAALVTANVGYYLYQGLNGNPWIDPSADQLLAWGGNAAMLTLTGDSWRLLSSVFVHGGLMHLVMNMYMLLILGSLAERRFGRIGLLMLFLAGGIVASCTSTWWQSLHTMGTDLLGRPFVRMVVGVGASGAIMAVAGALLAAHAVKSWYSSDHRSLAEAGFGKELGQVVAINLGMGFLMPGVDNAAHLGGVVAGLLMGASLQYVAELASTLIEMVSRVAIPAALAALCVAGLLHGSDWAEMRELRGLRDEQQAGESRANAEQQRVDAQKQAAESERNALPPPVSDEEARGRVIPFGESGTSFALSADGKTAYAVDHYQNKIQVIDLQRGAVVQSIAGPKAVIKGNCMDIFCGDPAAADIALLRQRPAALVSSMQKNAVVLIDLAAGQVSKTIAVGKSPNAILLSADDKRAYVHNVFDDTISVVDVDSAAVVQTLALPKEARSGSRPGHRLPMWLNADGTRLWVAFSEGAAGRQLSFDTATLKPVDSQEMSEVPDSVVRLSDSDGSVMALMADGVRVVHDGSTEGQPAWPFCTRIQPMQSAVSRAAGQPSRVAIADYRGYNGQDSLIHVANLQTSVTLGQYPVAGVAMKVQFSEDGSHVYAVTNGGSFVDIDTRKRLADRDDTPLLCSR